jgi:hypothetical protein
MSGSRTILAISLALAAAAPSIAPADAATVRRHVTCVAIYLVITAPLGGTVNSSSVDIKNNQSATIPAGTVFTYTIPAHQVSYTAPNALPPGGVLAIRDAAVTASGACDATYPETHFGGLTNATKLNGGQLKVQRSP